MSQVQLNTSTLAEFKHFVYGDTITMKTNAHASVRVAVEVLATKKRCRFMPQPLVHPCLNTAGMFDVHASFGD